MTPARCPLPRHYLRAPVSMLCLFIAGPLLERHDRVNPQLPWGQLLTGPEHAGSSRPSRTAGLPKTRLVQPELYEFYLPKLWNLHDPRISPEAACTAWPLERAA